MAKILVVDDSRTSRKILKGLLEENGHEVIAEAVNGDDGYLKYKELQPDIVTMDIVMPGMDGLEAAKAIRALDRPDAKTIPIFAMTANAFREDVTRSLDAGMNEHLTKPLEPEVVLRTLAKYRSK